MPRCSDECLAHTQWAFEIFSAVEKDCGANGVLCSAEPPGISSEHIIARGQPSSQEFCYRSAGIHFLVNFTVSVNFEIERDEAATSFQNSLVEHAKQLRQFLLRLPFAVVLHAPHHHDQELVEVYRAASCTPNNAFQTTTKRLKTIY